jgi:hypothetical protein
MEVVIVMTLLSILAAAVLSAYLFMGRNLERLAKTQQQDVRGRRVLFQFTQDVGSAIAFTSVTTSNLTMTVPTTLGLVNCSTTSGSATVTCTSTLGLTSGMSLTSLGTGIPASATVLSVTNATTFVMSSAATATRSGLAVTAMATPAAVTYLYDAAAGTLTRTANSVTTTLLTNINAAASNPSNGFVYYNAAGTAVTAAASVKSVECAFTTQQGSQANGTQSSYLLVSPRVLARNKQFLP